MSGFVKALRQHAKDVQRLEGATAEEFLRLLKETRDVIRGRMHASAREGDTLDAFRLRSMLAEAESGVDALERKAERLYSDAAKEGTELAVDHMGDELDRLSRAFDAKPLDLAIDAQRVLADPGQQLLANHFESSVSRYGLDLLNRVRQRLFIGLRTGDTVADLARDLGSETGPFGKIGRSNAERLVRTEVSAAYGSAQHTSLVEASRQVPSLKKVWWQTGSYDCPICKPLHGTERPIDGVWVIRSGRQIRKVTGPPGHPNCGCKLSAMKASWRAGLDKLGYLKEAA